MKFFVFKQMKGYSLAITLILLSIVVCIYGQKTDDNSELYDGEDISYEETPDSLQDLKFDGDSKTDGPPQQIGELEFDVEVAEQLPDSRQMAPEVLVVDDVSISFVFHSYLTLFVVFFYRKGEVKTERMERIWR